MTLQAREHEGACRVFASPCANPDAVVRAGVLARLCAGPGRVATVAAPGGYGKTTHLAAWVHTTDLPVAWIDLDVALDDPVILLPLLLEALGSVTDVDATDLLTATPTAGRTATVWAPRLGAAVRNCTVPFALVLDDVHTTRSIGAVDLIDAVVSNVPEGSRVVVCGRAVSLPSLARLRAGVGLTELIDTDLALDPCEARRLLCSIGLDLDADHVATLVADTEGWPVGIRLAGLALLGGADLAAHVSGREHTVSEYLQSEWLRGLEPADLRFLALVSGIDWLTGALCDHVLETSGSGAILSRIHSNRLLVIPLDRQHDAYRMHGLLREALEAEAERQFPDALRRVHERASEWFQRIGESDLAIRHAIHSHDLVRAEMLVVDFAPLCRTRGMVSTFDRWLSAFPLAHVQSAPSLSLVAAMLSLGTDSTAVRAWTSLCGRTLAAGVTCDTDPQVELKFLAWQAAVWNGPIEDAICFSAKAHRELPPGLWHTLACEAYGGHAFAAGHHELAGTLLAEGVAEARVFGARTMELLCAAHLAVVHHVDGHTERAVALALDTRRRVQEYELEHFPTLVVVTAVAAWAAALTGDLDATRRDLVVTRHCLALLDGVCAWATVQARLVAAEAAMLLGDRVMAATLLKEASVTLAGQPDAVTPHRQWAELEQQLVTTRQNLPVGPSALSTAELRVVHYLPTNLSIAEIGERLYVSRHTTKSHVAAIYRKLGTSSRQETVEACRAAGLLPSSWMSDD